MEICHGHSNCALFVTLSQSILNIFLIFVISYTLTRIINMDNPVGDFKTWYRSLPLFARTFMAGSFIIACLASLKILSIYYSAFIIDEIIYRLQVRSSVTCRFGESLQVSSLKDHSRLITSSMPTLLTLPYLESRLICLDEITMLISYGSCPICGSCWLS